MLLGNYSVLYKSPGRWFSGGATGQGMDRPGTNTPGSQRGRFCGWAGISPKAAHPEGYTPGAALVVAQQTGGAGSRNQMIGTGTTGSVDVSGGLNGTAILSGTGTVGSANLALIVSALATITASGGLSGDVRGVLNATSTIAGTGDLSGTSSALAHLVAVLAGAATLSPAGSAVGSVSATITSATLLSPESLAAALLDAENAIESGMTLRQALRVIAAATAGKVSGADGTTITIRNAAADSKDRIVATVDSAGNRSAITLDLT